MELWFDALPIFEKIYWVVAIISSVILLILLIFTMIGSDADEFGGDLDAEIEGDTGIDFQFLSIKNFVAFLTVFGWSGIACLESGWSRTMTVLISMVCGLIMMFAMASLFYYLSKLQSSGTLKLRNALNQVCEVYLTIGSKRSSIGKVSIKVQGTLRELDALTEEARDLEMGDVVKVREVTKNGILIVELLNK